METEGTPLIQKSSDSSLTESWNVVDAQEVNNASEGSDGESIEVIDEEAHHRDSTPENGSDSKAVTPIVCPVVPNSAEENLNGHSFTQGDSTQPGNEDIVVLGSTHHGPPRQETSGGNHLYFACFFIGLILSVLLSGAVLSLFLLKVEEFASDQFKYLASYYTTFNSANDYQELLDQIKIYKEESKDLKGIVADLNAAVQNLKNELASKTSGSMLQGDVTKQIVNEEDDLFRQLLNIHSGNFQSGNDSDHIPEEYENSFTVIENMLKRLTEDEEREKNMETIKLFYLIPKHLSVLGAHYLTNDNIRQFIDIWKSKLSVINENMINDMKEMQLKMIRHTVKHLKHTEKCFFKKLCDLKNFNKEECYEAFIKPYETTDTNLDDVIFEDSFCSADQKKKTKNGNGSETDRNQSCTPKTKRNSNKKNIKIQEPDYQFQKYVENKHANNVNMDDKIVKKNERKPPLERKVDQNKQAVKEKPQPSFQRKIKKVVEKGMDSDLLHVESLGKNIEMDGTNSFSSFSGADCSRKGQYWKGKDQEGWWFLKLGKHRSEVREAESKGDWFFERAWRRKTARHWVLSNKPVKPKDIHTDKKNRYDRLLHSFIHLRNLFFL